MDMLGFANNAHPNLRKWNCDAVSAGGCCWGAYFFTVNIAERDRALLVDYVGLLRDVMKRVKLRHPFEIDAMVVLPDHLHAIWTLPDGDASFAKRWMLIKAGFSRQLNLNERRSLSRKRKSERGIWQRRYWEHLIRNERDFNNHVDYIHFAALAHPCAHGTCASVHIEPSNTDM